MSTPHRLTMPMVVGAFALAAVVILSLSAPDLASAALKGAAGGGKGAGGFSTLTGFLDRVGSMLLPVAIPAAGLGLAMGGFMMFVGNPNAVRVLGFVGMGLAIVLGSKGIAA